MAPDWIVERVEAAGFDAVRVIGKNLSANGESFRWVFSGEYVTGVVTDPRYDLSGATITDEARDAMKRSKAQIIRAADGWVERLGEIARTRRPTEEETTLANIAYRRAAEVSKAREI